MCYNVYMNKENKCDKEMVETKIFDISYEGAGVGRVNGQIIFVPKTLKDENVKAVVTKRNSHFLQGRLYEVLQASPLRQIPFCPYFDKCGGCDFQHCSYLVEQDIKKEILSEELAKIGFYGKIDFQPSDERKHYRNKIKMEVKNNRIGFFKAKSHDFFEIETCPIASEKINAVLPLVKIFLKENNFNHIKSIYVKQVKDRLAICFLFEDFCEKDQKRMIKSSKLLDIFQDIAIYFGFGDVLESDKTKLICVSKGQGLVFNFKGKTFDLNVSAFNQVNDVVAEKLYQYVVDHVNGKRVINAYSGQGLLTLMLAEKAKFVYGIEWQRSAHESAERLKDFLEEYRLENICGRVEDEIGSVLLRDNIDSIVLDPAREGCKNEVLKAICDGKIGQVIYISCNFSTLVRDAKNLQGDFEIESVKIFDMFPCTANMETVMILRRKG